ncbi:hypothetical protein [Lacticaseibacillus sp. GG6-2]
MTHVKKSHAYGLLIILVLAAVVFSWIGWFATNPQDWLAKVSTISLGVGLAVGVWLLVGLDDSCQTRKGRFWVDIIVGGCMMLLIYLFMLGLTFDWLFTFGAVAIVFVLAFLFSFRHM